ncbi:MAG: hypothetical protein NUV91_06530 [Candidatus Omnitrophica bacterium]|nr:hypothetical protein [Candidatus Omnitrophota bacterium]
MSAMKPLKFLAIIWALGFSFIFVSRSQAATTSHEVQQKFSEANAAYRKGDYSNAQKIYEGIIQQGWESGPLYYNLANSYFKRGEIGEAVLNYERSSRLIPRDPDLKANSHYVRSLIDSNLFFPENSFVEQLMLPWEWHMEFYTLNEIAMMLVILVALLAIVHMSGIYLQWPKRLRSMAFGFLFGVFCVFATSFMVKMNHEQNMAMAIVPTMAHFEPRDDATVHFDLKEGNHVKILKASGIWWKVKRPDGKMGWIPQKDLQEVEPQG